MERSGMRDSWSRITLRSIRATQKQERDVAKTARKNHQQPDRRTQAAARLAPVPVPSGAAARDDSEIPPLDLPPAPLTPAMEAYFAKCEEKLGFVPNVLKACGFDMAKLEAFVAMYK